MIKKHREQRSGNKESKKHCHNKPDRNIFRVECKEEQQVSFSKSFIVLITN